MRYLTTLIILFFTVQICHSQTHELGVFLGGSNFIGDIGSTKYISPNKPAIGAVWKWNRSNRHSFRFSAIFSELEGRDIESDDPRRQERNYSFKNGVVELAAGLEFTFFDYSLHDGRRNFTPYLFSGIAVAYHDNFYYRNDRIIDEDTESLAFGIPMALGVKGRLTEHIILSFEIGARYTFSDEIDGSEPDSHQIKDTMSIGNVNNNDWYVFSGLTITYTFGRKPCYCNF